MSFYYLYGTIEQVLKGENTMNVSTYQPPYTLTDRIVTLCTRITEEAIKISIYDTLDSNPRLRRDNRVKTIQASLAIENNTMSVEQVTDILNGKRVLGSQAEIREVKNAFEAYKGVLSWDPLSIDDMLEAHSILMKDLTKEAGIFRSKGVGICAGEKMVHMAPPAERVPELISNLMDWTKNSQEVHPLIRSSVFHYEFEFIHPFADGNGRMGRMWQTVLLYQWNSLFGWLPVETIIKERQEEYYQVLGECDRMADSGIFIEFVLQAILDVLLELQRTVQVSVQVTDQVKRLLSVFGQEVLSTKELMERLQLRHRPTFRDNYILPALGMGLIEMTIPDKPRSSKQKYRIV